MKIIFVICLHIVTLVLRASDVIIHVVDESNRPFVGADGVIGFAMVRLNSDVEHKGQTDVSGALSARGQAEHSVYVRVEAPGCYSARFDRLPHDKDINLNVTLPKIIHPVALFALNACVGKRDTEKPHQRLRSGEPYGFDFEVGDLVAPYGKGRLADISFKVKSEFKGWLRSEREIEAARKHPVNRGMSEETFRYWNGKWDGDLEISFIGTRVGLVEEKARFRSYSRLKMPHQAPGDGYEPTKRYTANNYKPRARDIDSNEVGFFLRTRVKLDKDGGIASANYSKVVGDFQFDPRGSVMFTYYFNPVPNDRNLEFDPKRNLFPANLPGANVSDP